MKRGLLAVLAAVLLTLGLAGCGTIGSLVATDNALHNDGFQSVGVSPQPSTNSLNVGVTVSALPEASDARQVAAVVWRSFHERFDYVTVTVHGNGQAVHEEFSFAQMQEAFGARDPAWNRTSVKSGVTGVGVTILVGIVVLVLLVVGVVLLVRRRNRRRRPPWTGGQYPGPYPGQYQGPYPGQYQGPYPGQYQGPYSGQNPGQYPGAGPPGGYGPPEGYGPPPQYPPYPPPAGPPRWDPPPSG